ncbi:MAG: regulatory iron-sulfur-containing complex subunit RicT [Saprospiraceae bacterium]
MGCSTCSVDKTGTPKGCGDKGNCSSGTCNKMNSYDWIVTKDLYDPSEYNYVEVSFKKGAHKDFFKNSPNTHCVTGDMVVVETTNGYDVGRITLSGELVRIQMKKKFTTEDKVTFNIIRKANERDLEKLDEARTLEKSAMVKARVIARSLGLDMKVGDVEYQGDKKKATFYYTAEGRVDFRELVKEYAREFKVKIEMRQIGARQESARIGGIGSCGRELCCSTWLSDFKSVNTSAARYQSASINQTKLSGQCGRLKCCLNYELDMYMEAVKDFPDDVEVIKTKIGTASLIKTDIFKGIMYYAYDNDRSRSNFISVTKDRVKEIKQLNKKGIFPDEILDKETLAQIKEVQDNTPDYEDVTGQIELPIEKRRKKKKRPSDRNNGPQGQNNQRQGGPQPQQQPKLQDNRKPQQPKEGQKPNPPANRPDNRPQDPNTPHGSNPPRKKKFFKKNKGNNNPGNNNPGNNNNS